MGQFLLEGPTLPPLAILAFLVPLSLQCLLLHPVFPRALSRPARFLLMPLSLAYSFAAPYRYAIHPRNQAVGVNFVLGIMGAYGIMKAAEWGLAQDLLPYTWLGLDGPAADKRTHTAHRGHSDSKEDRKDARRRRRAHLRALREQQARTDGPLDILRATLHLLVSMRGQGYDFCGTTTAPFAIAHGPFLCRLVVEIAWSHPLLVACVAVLLEPPSSRDALVCSALPALSIQHAHYLGEVVAAFSMGLAVFAALTCGYSCATLVVFVATFLARLVPLPEALTLPRFDPREYPPLFNLARRPSSVARFWSQQWHSFFSRPFRFLAFQPVQRLFTPLLGKLVGRALGVLAVFALSAWLHEFGLATSISTLPPPPRPLDFLTTWGGSVYFLAQGFAIVLEGAFAAVVARRRRRFRGWAGSVWTGVFVALAGGWLYRSWMTQGLIREVPPARYWAWQRAVIPLGCLLPPPVWMRSFPAHYRFERA
ncbi:hypothetical protein JCM3770_006885 [Rhodotorula araucariae]